MSKLKLKINVNLLNLLCIVVSCGYMANLSDLLGFAFLRFMHISRLEYNS